jgi:hypothetical protein
VDLGLWPRVVYHPLHRLRGLFNLLLRNVELPLYKNCFENTRSSKLVCETFTDLNDPARGETLHKIFMAKVPNDTNQGTPSQGDSCVFPFFRNISVPLMATLYIPGLNVGQPGWLGTIANVPNALDAS